MMKNNRMSLDDILNQRSSEDYAVEPVQGKLRVIKKKVQPPPELYQNEKELKKAGSDFLKSIPGFLFLPTDNSGLMVRGKMRGKTRIPGFSDHHLCAVGLFVAVEAKMPGKDLDPDQVKYRGKVLAAKGIFIVYHSLYELVQELKRHRLLSRKFEL